MKVTFAHLCEYAMMSADRKLSVIGIFSSIRLRSLPGVHPQMFLAFEVEMNSAELGKPFTIVVECTDADGAKIFSTKGAGTSEGRVPFGENPRFAQFLAFRNTKFTRSGDHGINIWLNDRLEFQYKFQVIVARPNSAPPSLTPPPK